MRYIVSLHNCEENNHQAASTPPKANLLVKGLPGGYKIGQVIVYRKWESPHRTETSLGADLNLPHTGCITGFDIRNEQFYFIVEYRGRYEEVKPEDIET